MSIPSEFHIKISRSSSERRRGDGVREVADSLAAIVTASGSAGVDTASLHSQLAGAFRNASDSEARSLQDAVHRWWGQTRKGLVTGGLNTSGLNTGGLTTGSLHTGSLQSGADPGSAGFADPGAALRAAPAYVSTFPRIPSAAEGIGTALGAPGKLGAAPQASSASAVSTRVEPTGGHASRVDADAQGGTGHAAQSVEGLGATLTDGLQALSARIEGIDSTVRTVQQQVGNRA